jgi:MscS family membrane protein
MNSHLSRHRTIVVSILLLLSVGQVSTTAQEQPPATEPVVQPAPLKPLPELKSPRDTLRTFLRTMREGDVEGAVACLDLSYLTSNVVEASGPSVAHQVKTALDRLVGITLDDPNTVWKDIPDNNDYAEPFKLNAIRNSLDKAQQIVIGRGEDGNWRFTEDTCRDAETYFNELEKMPTLVSEKVEAKDLAEVLFSMRLRQWFPAPLRETHFVLPDYQWLCLLFVIFLGLAADVVVRNLSTWIADRWFARKVAPGETVETTEKVWRPLGRLANATTWYLGTYYIGLHKAVLDVLLNILQLFTIIAAVWTAFALIDLVAKYWTRRAKTTDTRFDDLLVPLVSKSLKMFALCMGFLTAAQTFDLPIFGLMGGLGLGGAALALASKDTVSNFFGSITVLFDRPFEVGDWIVTTGAEGTVEAVGFRSTRIRTFYNSMITLPNSLLTTSIVDNMGRRRFRRIKTTLGVQYDTTPEQLDAFCEGIRELIRQHPYTRKDYYHVYFNDFGPSSLDIMLYCFVACPDWAIELRERHRLLSDIVKLAKKLNVHFAFPTRTVHMFNEQTAPTPQALSEPLETGKQLAGDIVGEMPDQIPGPVKF